MIRVALVITELDIGGAERQLVNLATGLDRRWYKPRVYALGPPPREDRDELVRRLKEYDIPVEFLSATRWWQYPQTVQRLTAHLRDFRPHVMQSFLFHANVIGTQAARQAQVPKVAIGIRVADRRRLRAWLERRAALQADKVVCVSRAVAELVGRQLNVAHDASQRKLQTIPNGIVIERFRDAQPTDLTSFGIPPSQRVVTCVGRLAAQKGLGDLLKVLPELVQRVPSVALLLVGDGPLKSALKQQATRLGVEQRVHFAQWQPNIPGILAASQVLALPSRYEGMPNAVMEAMAAGLPVVARPVEGVPELLGDTHPLQYCQTAREFADALAQLLQHEHLARAVGDQNRARIEQHFSLPAMVATYERMFAELAAGLPGTTQFGGVV